MHGYLSRGDKTMTLISIYVDGSGLRGEPDVAMHSLDQEKKKAVLKQMYEKAVSWNLQFFRSDEYLPIVTPESREYADYYFEDNVTPARMMEVYGAVMHGSVFPEAIRSVASTFKIDDSDVQKILKPHINQLHEWRKQYFVLSTMSGTPVLVSRTNLGTYSGKKVVGRESVKDKQTAYFVQTHFQDEKGKIITIQVWGKPFKEDFIGFLDATEHLVKGYDELTEGIRTLDYGSTMRENRLREVEKVNEEYHIKLRGVLPGEKMPEGTAYGGRGHEIIIIRYNDNKYAAIETVGLFDDYTVDFRDITKEQFEQARQTAVAEKKDKMDVIDIVKTEQILKKEFSVLRIFSQEPLEQDGSLVAADAKTLKTIVILNYYGHTERVADGETRQEALIKILPNTYRIILNEAEFRNGIPQDWLTKSTENTPDINRVITIVKSFVRSKAKAGI